MNSALEIIRERLGGGRNRLEAVPLYPGIDLIYLTLVQDARSSSREGPEHILQINYCRAGQAVWEMGRQNHIYLNPENFSVHTMPDCAKSALTFPTGRYEGVMLCVDLQQAAAHPPDLFEDTAVFSLLRNKFCHDGRPVFLSGNSETRRIFSALYQDPEGLERPYRRLKALELLLYLSGLTPACREQLSEFRREHVAIVREIHGQLLDHMERRITIEELSRQYLINPTTLKAVFKSVYGASLAAHIKEHRMEQAAKLLRETDQSVAEIAWSVGYDSQSKFTAAFKEVFHALPTAYRRERQGQP